MDKLKKLQKLKALKIRVLANLTKCNTRYPKCLNSVNCKGYKQAMFTTLLKSVDKQLSNVDNKNKRPNYPQKQHRHQHHFNRFSTKKLKTSLKRLSTSENSAAKCE